MVVVVAVVDQAALGIHEHGYPKMEGHDMQLVKNSEYWRAQSEAVHFRVELHYNRVESCQDQALLVANDFPVAELVSSAPQ